MMQNLPPIMTIYIALDKKHNLIKCPTIAAVVPAGIVRVQIVSHYPELSLPS